MVALIPETSNELLVNSSGRFRISVCTVQEDSTPQGDVRFSDVPFQPQNSTPIRAPFGSLGLRPTLEAMLCILRRR